MIKLCGRCCQHFLYQHLVCQSITIIIHLVSKSHQSLKVVIYLLIILHFHQLILSPQILKLHFLYICPTFITLLKDILCTLGICIFNILLKHLNINILVFTFVWGIICAYENFVGDSTPLITYSYTTWNANITFIWLNHLSKLWIFMNYEFMFMIL